MSREMKEFKTEKCSLLPMGSGLNGENLHFSINTKEALDKVILFEHGTRKVAGYARVQEEEHFGDLYAFRVLNAAHYDYALMAGEKYIRDEYAKAVNHYRLEDGTELETYSTYVDDFDWQDDERIFHPFEDSVMYRLHVKGFTKHHSSGVQNRGCYAGIVEKIPYLLELGVTTVELMPAYEFDEQIMSGRARGTKNYWGYGTANYFAPKAGFSRYGKGSQINEFKEMVRELHKNQIEVIMEFHFVEGTSPHTIMDALRFWVLEYHIDGIHANFNVAPLNMIKSDPIISMVKIISNYDTGENMENYGHFRDKRRYAIMNDTYIVQERRFIKSDDDQVSGMMEQLRRNPHSHAIINYISSIYSRNTDSIALKKVIFIDNPFGAAKDIYIWEPIFKMLKTNNVQLIVPCRGATPAITGRFDVNYVLGQKLVNGRQQTVVVDYYSSVDSEKLDYTTMTYEQGVLDLVMGNNAEFGESI